MKTGYNLLEALEDLNKIYNDSEEAVDEELLEDIEALEYEAEIDEGLTLQEAQERGKFKKAFLNLVKRNAYWDGTNVKADNGFVQNKTGISGNIYDIIKEINAKSADKKNHISLYKTVDGKTERVPYGELVKIVNARLRNDGQRAIVTSRAKPDAKNTDKSKKFTVFNLYHSVLHHIDGNHGNNVAIKSVDNTTLVDTASEAAWGNYLLIEGVTARAATYAHKMIHLLAIITSTLGLPTPKEDEDNVIGQIANALEDTLKNSELTFSYIIKKENNIPVIYSTHSFAEAVRAITYGNSLPNNDILAAHEKDIKAAVDAAASDEQADQTAPDKEIPESK